MARVARGFLVLQYAGFKAHAFLSQLVTGTDIVAIDIHPSIQNFFLTPIVFENGSGH